MNYLVNKHIDVKKYDYFISIGDKCPTAETLKYLGLRKVSFPFDYIPSKPSLILKYLINGLNDFFPDPQTSNEQFAYNKDGIYFEHFDFSEDEYSNTVDMFTKRYKRLNEIFKQKKETILFVYTEEGSIYNNLNKQYDNNYNDILEIRNYLINNFNYTNFDILVISNNKIYNDEMNIINFNINIDEEYFSNDLSTHNIVYPIYRPLLVEMMKKIFLIE